MTKGGTERVGARLSALSRARVLRRWEQSGLSAKAFASEAGVSTWTLYEWRRRARQRREPGRKSGSEFLQIDLSEANRVQSEPALGGTPRAVLVFPFGVRIEFSRGAEAMFEAAVARLLARC